MIIEHVTEREKTVCFNQLVVGEVFSSQGMEYLKVGGAYDNVSKKNTTHFNAFNLNKNYLTTFSKDASVLPLKAKLVIIK